eukprot:TRINITY_DN21719_c0_g1_i1.p1 TRINITY_DN21719_c0_g1~~TRINITY_DN21719_c0_g1_i1.p1  ORF type:complete len:838 (-),score=115.64 TRINITY_DN21719_c0_g1_i1:153-2666(-)
MVGAVFDVRRPAEFFLLDKGGLAPPPSPALASPTTLGTESTPTAWASALSPNMKSVTEEVSALAFSSRPTPRSNFVPVTASVKTASAALMTPVRGGASTALAVASSQVAPAAQAVVEAQVVRVRSVTTGGLCDAVDSACCNSPFDVRYPSQTGAVSAAQSPLQRRWNSFTAPPGSFAATQSSRLGGTVEAAPSGTPTPTREPPPTRSAQGSSGPRERRNTRSSSALGIGPRGCIEDGSPRLAALMTPPGNSFRDTLAVAASPPNATPGSAGRESLNEGASSAASGVPLPRRPVATSARESSQSRQQWIRQRHLSSQSHSYQPPLAHRSSPRAQSFSRDPSHNARPPSHARESSQNARRRGYPRESSQGPRAEAYSQESSHDARTQVRPRSIDPGTRIGGPPARCSGRASETSSRVASGVGGVVETNGRGSSISVADRRGVTKADASVPIVEEDCSEYSDRFLPGYQRNRLLGRGACAVVWLATPRGGTGTVAIKQVAKGTKGKKRSDTEAARKEILFGSYFFHTGGEPKLPPSRHPGIDRIAKLLDHTETKRDIWLVMEYGGTSLTKCAYEIRGEFCRGERLYRVHHQPMLQSMKQRDSVLKSMLRQLLSALSLFAEHHIVHSDIKPDNILIAEESNGDFRCRFIDLGSAFDFEKPENLALATPEYMPPEALENCVETAANLGLGRGCMGRSGGLTGTGTVGARKAPSPADSLAKLRAYPWSFDVWSLGSILLELSLGLPLWLSYKCRVGDDQRLNSASTGLFATPGRDAEKILAKQADALRNRGLTSVLRNAAGVPLVAGGQELLSRMLVWNPMDRISPQEALRQRWLNEESTPTS